MAVNADKPVAGRSPAKRPEKKARNGNCPDRTRGSMDYRRFLKLSEELEAFTVSLHTLYFDAVVGFETLHQRLLEHQHQSKLVVGDCEEGTDQFQDKCVIDYKRLCGEEFHVASISSSFMKQGEVKERTGHDGSDYMLMGRLCVAQAFAFWEDYLRAEIGIALGVLRRDAEKDDKDAILSQHVSIDFWGDMRHLRQSILHHKGKATSECATKSRWLKWFKPDEDINLDFAKMQFIFDQMAQFVIVLHNLSLPPRTMKFPSKSS